MLHGLKSNDGVRLLLLRSDGGWKES